jgi:hypothetical protein
MDMFVNRKALTQLLEMIAQVLRLVAMWKSISAAARFVMRSCATVATSTFDVHHFFRAWIV